jgi:predicted GNAT family acetyltransferase
MTFDIRNNEAASRYETIIDGHVAFSEYRLEEPNRIVFTHTLVPEQLGGRGIAGAIVKFALDDVRAKGQRVVAQCPYVAAYIAKHAEVQDLVAT